MLRILKIVLMFLVYYECWFIHLFHTNYLEFLQIPPCGRIFSGKDTEKRIEEIERLNPYRPDCFGEGFEDFLKLSCVNV